MYEDAKAYTYKVLVAPTELAVTLAEVKTHLRLDIASTAQDAYLTSLIKAATLIGEKYTKRIFINTKFLTYRDFFSDCIELKKSRFQILHSFKYSVNYSLIDVDPNLYYTTDETDFSKIILKEESQYPDDIDNKLQSIAIEFTAGYGINNTFVPADVKEALLSHIAAMYEDRGDCNLLSSAESALPQTTKDFYYMIRIWDI